MCFFFTVLVHEYEEIELDGISSLQHLFLRINSEKGLSVRNLPSLKHLDLLVKKLNRSISEQLFENLLNIKKLVIIAEVFSDINLDYLVNLVNLTISGEIDEGFNFELFENIC